MRTTEAGYALSVERSESWPLRGTQTSSMRAMSAASPWRAPSLRMRV